jgi:hypothetical protein
MFMVGLLGNHARPGMNLFAIPTAISKLAEHAQSHPVEAVVGGAALLVAYGLLANGLKGAWDFIKTADDFKDKFPKEGLPISE